MMHIYISGTFVKHREPSSVICSLPMSSHSYYSTHRPKMKQEHKGWWFCKAAWPENTSCNSRPQPFPNNMRKSLTRLIDQSVEDLATDNRSQKTHKQACGRCHDA
jgi:hypothetical protein